MVLLNQKSFHFLLFCCCFFFLVIFASVTICLRCTPERFLCNQVCLYVSLGVYVENKRIFWLDIFTQNLKTVLPEDDINLNFESRSSKVPLRSTIKHLETNFKCFNFFFFCGWRKKLIVFINAFHNIHLHLF